MTDRELHFYKKVGQRIRDIRQMLGMSQEKLADRVEMQGNTIHRYETAEQRMNLMTANDLASALGISLNALVPSATTHNVDQSEIEKEAIYRYHKLSVDDQLFVLRIILTISG